MALFISAGPLSHLTSNYNVCTVFSCEYIVLDIGERKYLGMTAHHPVYRRETDTLNKEHITGRWRGKLYWFWRFPLKETPGSQCTLRQELQYMKHAFLACGFCQARSEKEPPFFSSVWSCMWLCSGDSEGSLSFRKNWTHFVLLQNQTTLLSSVLSHPVKAKGARCWWGWGRTFRRRNRGTLAQAIYSKQCDF